jgi:threonine/homoserine/homoserine lactone efflux protein
MRTGHAQQFAQPQGAVVFVVFLPQFVRPEAGPIATQLWVLGGVLTFIAAVFHSVLGVFGGAASRFQRPPRHRHPAEVGPGHGADGVGRAPGADGPTDVMAC